MAYLSLAMIWEANSIDTFSEQQVSAQSGEYDKKYKYPPAPRCGDSDQGGCVGEWMVPRSYGIHDSEKGLHITKQTRKFLGVFEVSEKRRRFSKQTHS